MIDPLPTPEEQEILDQVEQSLSRSLALRDWWQAVDEDDGYRDRFPLTTTFNRPDGSFGFFSEAVLPQEPDLIDSESSKGGEGQAEAQPPTRPVMGVVQEQFYDRPKIAAGRRPGEDTSEQRRQSALWMRDQIREFVLRYFMRVSDFSVPEVYARGQQGMLPWWLKPLAWGDQGESRSRGFGFEQIFFKTLDGDIGRFPESQRFAVVDLRDLRMRYAWVVLKVDIFGFQFQLAPFGLDQPHGILPVPESTYVVISPDFVIDQELSSPGELGRFGFGYGFLPSPKKKLFTYGPGRFDVGFQLFEFEARPDGEVLSRMAFVADRPEKILNLAADPVDLGVRAADAMSFGLASRFIRPFVDPENPRARPDEPRTPVGPVDAYVGMANLMTGGLAGRRLSITKKQLEIDFLVRQFLQNYNVVTGSLVTWRQIPDWLARDALPAWVESGISS